MYITLLSLQNMMIANLPYHAYLGIKSTHHPKKQGKLPYASKNTVLIQAIVYCLQIVTDYVKCCWFKFISGFFVNKGGSSVIMQQWLAPRSL